MPSQAWFLNIEISYYQKASLEVLADAIGGSRQMEHAETFISP